MSLRLNGIRAAARAASLVVVVASFALLLAVGIGPHTGRYRTATVLTGSMAPAIPAGAVVVLVPAHPSQVHEGDVVTYHAPVDGRPVVTHRVVDVLERGPEPVVVTKGDANAAPDPWAARLGGPTLWRARAAVPGLGFVLGWLRHPVAHRTTVLALPAILALLALAAIWKPERKSLVASDVRP